MDIKQLRYFIAIAEEGSLSAASVKLGVAQPSLSQHVIKLEEELGVQLIHRSARGVMITPSGEILLEHARIISRQMSLCQEQVRRSGSTPEGTVSFGLPPSVSMVLSVPLAETVRVELPRVKLRVVEAMSGFVASWLQEETVDLGFLYDLTNTRNLDVQELMQEELHVFAPPDNWPLARPPGEPVPLAEVAALELILPSQHHGLRKTVDRYAESRGITLNVSLEMDALSQIKDLVVRGSGFTILAPAAVHDRLERGELVGSPIIEPVATRPVYLARKHSRLQTYASHEVERITLDVVSDLIRRGLWKAKVQKEG